MRITGTDVMALTIVAIGGVTGVAVTSLANRADWNETTTVTTTTWGAAPQDRHEGDNILRFRSEVIPAQPLIYIDGVRTDRNVEDLAPDEIERIEVVKGAAAIELFGEEALGGVIQIFTKRSMTREPGT